VRLTARFAVLKLLDTVLPGRMWRGTIRRTAARHQVPCRTVANVNAPDYVERLRAFDLDLLVSVAASQIFKKDLIAVPRLAAINIHTGTLPRYRGMLPVFWQMADGQPSIGITIHTMTTDIDLGQIVLQREVPIVGARSLDHVIRTMKRHGAQAMVELLERYDQGTVAPRAMDRSQEGYRSFPGRAEALAFRKKGYRLL
jgi:methionyl-tRNA formyltransferase